MDEKISIILPIFNVEDSLRQGIDSLINQSIGRENLEIIMVDDCSSDKSGAIIDEYDDKYDCCIAIHLDKNTGAANGPRNIGLEISTGDYVMFLDPDDEYALDACEKLYSALKYRDADMAFGRYLRIFNGQNKIQKSYSPYNDNLNEVYQENFEISNPLNVSDILWKHIFKRMVYGKDIKGKYDHKKSIDIIEVDDITQEADLLKISPSVWCKIYKKEFITKNGIEFPPYVCGDDLVFTLKSLLNADGIVFLNDFVAYHYYFHDFSQHQSITNTINVRFLGDLLDAYTCCRKETQGFSKDIQMISVNPHLFYWFRTWKSASLSKEENILLLNKLRNLEKIHNSKILSLIIFALKLSVR
jgi:glycosyltransferase involved in cell wall biosynthesis